MIQNKAEECFFILPRVNCFMNVGIPDISREIQKACWKDEKKVVFFLPILEFWGKKPDNFASFIL